MGGGAVFFVLPPPSPGRPGCTPPQVRAAPPARAQ